MLQTPGRQRSAVTVSLRFGKDFDAHASTAATVQVVNRAAQALGRGHLDALLVPWPITSAGERSASVTDTKARDAAKFAKTWTALLSLVQAGTVRHIGLDECLPWHIDLLQHELKLQPAMNLLQVSPLQQRAQLVAFCQARSLEVLAVLSIDTADYANLSRLALPLVSTSNNSHDSMFVNHECMKLQVSESQRTKHRYCAMSGSPSYTQCCYCLCFFVAGACSGLHLVGTAARHGDIPHCRELAASS
jgi:Aldo/keto reductase family